MSKYSELEPIDNSPDTHSLEPVRMAFAGHRGFGARQVQPQRDENLRFPENSLISLQKVMESGAEFIEFDLYLSQDEQLMVIHDDDLSINAKYIVQRENEMARPDGGFYPIGHVVDFPPGATLVSNLPNDFIRRAFDISGGIDIPDGVDPKFYRTIPEFHEVLELVSAENARRIEIGQPRIKLNVELKGVGTGTFVQEAIEVFNHGKDPDQQIHQDEIYYMSFLDGELATIAGLIGGSRGAAVPDANLILGVPTDVQYMKVGERYSIEDSNLNIKALSEKVMPLHNALKNLEGRQGRGLTGVDMSLWDVSEASIDYFCEQNDLPIHVAVVPFGERDLVSDAVYPGLINIEKVANAQNKYVGQNGVMIVKADDPVLLETMIREISSSKEPVILGASVFNLKGTPGNQTIKLFTKPGTHIEPPQQTAIQDRSWWGPEQIIPALQEFTDSYVANPVATSEELDIAFNDVVSNGVGSGLIPLNVNVVTGELNGQRNHWVGLQLLGNDSAISVNYIDPMGRPINEQTRQQILEKFGYETVINEPLRGKAIQNARIVEVSESPDEMPIFVCKGNDYDCGPMLTHAMICLTTGQELPNETLSPEESKKLGQNIRQELEKHGITARQEVVQTAQEKKDLAIEKAKAMKPGIQAVQEAKQREEHPIERQAIRRSNSKENSRH